MYISLSKRFEFCASHRCFVPDWSDEQNYSFFGDEAKGNFGHGHNYTAFFVFHGKVDPKTGIMVNFFTIKQKINTLLESRFDHKHLNIDTPPFDRIVSTPENLAKQLLTESFSLFSAESAKPVVCHLRESSDDSATAYASRRVEKDLWLDFSAARRTHSPHLSEEENFQMFGQAASLSGHGHSYRLRVTLEGELTGQAGMIYPLQPGREVLLRLHSELDHRNLNCDLPDLRGIPITTEILARFIWDRLKGNLPLGRVKLYENPDFFIEYHGDNRFMMGITGEFRAAHRLNSQHLSEQDNKHIYGKCNNPNGHGHQYQVECTVGGEFDERSGTLHDLARVNRILSSTLAEWHYKHLELETEDFKNTPSTGENIVQTLWKKLDPKFNRDLYRLRIWETPNNRITLRREIKA